jgi:PepSY-associated TM region
MRYLILIHRYLGTGIGILMVGWCLTGVVMMYVRYPLLSQAERLRHLQPVEWSGCCVVSAASLSNDAVIEGFEIESLDGRPVLHLQFAGGDGRLIDLLNGHAISAVSQQQAAGIAARYRPEIPDHSDTHTVPPPRLSGLINYDQWTVSGEFNHLRPLYRFALDDPSGTQVYVSAKTGQVVQVTTRHQRFWNWIGTVPHWLYFAQLRHDATVWIQVVIWTSMAGCFLVLFGIYIGLRQFLRRPAGRWSAYRGLLYWHHLPGVIFGFFALTWVASGLVSMNPWGFLDSAGANSALDNLTGPPTSGTQVRQAVRLLQVAAPPQVVTVDSTRLWGQLHLIVTRIDGARVRIGAEGGPAALAASDWRRIAHAVGGRIGTEPELMTAGDPYYYSRPGVAVQFPVYRIVMDDAHTTRLYIDPVTGTPVDIVDRDGRWYRWLHVGLHTLDFSAATRSRPLWDVMMLALLAGVTMICGTGTWLGWRRYVRIRQR